MLCWSRHTVGLYVNLFGGDSRMNQHLIHCYFSLFSWIDHSYFAFTEQKKTLEHPVVQALGAVINENRLSKHWFTRLLEARVCWLETVEALIYFWFDAVGVRSPWLYAFHCGSSYFCLGCYHIALGSLTYAATSFLSGNDYLTRCFIS